MRRRSAAGACRSRESSGTANDAAMRVAGQGPGWHFDPRRHPRGVFAALPIEASDTHNDAVAFPGARPMHTLYYSPGAASMVVHWLLIEQIGRASGRVRVWKSVAISVVAVSFNKNTN